MKLSYRDKVFIIIATVVVVIVAGIFAFIKPKYAEIQISNDAVAAKEAEKAQVEEKIGTLEFLKDSLKNNVKAVDDLQKKFMSEKDYGTTYQVGEYLTELLTPSGITIRGMEYDDMDSISLNPYYYAKNAVAYQLKADADLNNELPEEVYFKLNNSYPDGPAGVAVAGTQVKVTYECSPDIKELLDAIDIVADVDTTIYLNTVSSKYEFTAEGDEEPIGTGELVITVYEIYPMDVDSVK